MSEPQPIPPQSEDVEEPSPYPAYCTGKPLFDPRSYIPPEDDSDLYGTDESDLDEDDPDLDEAQDDEEHEPEDTEATDPDGPPSGQGRRRPSGGEVAFVLVTSAITLWLVLKFLAFCAGVLDDVFGMGASDGL